MGLSYPPPIENPPPPITLLFCWAISIAVVCVPHCMALPLLRISHLCVFCDILSPKAVYRVSNTTPYSQNCDKGQINQNFGRDVEEQFC